MIYIVCIVIFMFLIPGIKHLFVGDYISALMSFTLMYGFLHFYKYEVKIRNLKTRVDMLEKYIKSNVETYIARLLCKRQNK